MGRPRKNTSTATTNKNTTNRSTTNKNTPKEELPNEEEQMGTKTDLQDQSSASEEEVEPILFDFGEIEEEEKIIEQKSSSTVATSRLDAIKNNPIPEDIYSETDTSILDTNIKPEPGQTPALSKEQVEVMIRLEEQEAAEVKAKGRYIPNIDDVKPGTTFWQPNANQVNDDQLPFQIMNSASSRSPNQEGMILDTGEGAQKKEDIDIPTSDDPRSPDYMACMNKNCPYREGCLRYRMHNQREKKVILFPEDCRYIGVYQSVNETDFTGYSPFTQLETTGTPSVF